MKLSPSHQKTETKTKKQDRRIKKYRQEKTHGNAKETKGIKRDISESSRD